MKLLSYFDAFLRDAVNLDERRLDLLDSRVQSIYAVVAMDDLLGPKIVDYTPQGSWAHKTIIKPLPGDEFDADFLLQISEDADWSADPKRYLSEARAAFGRSSLYSDKVQSKNRCVRIVYADECHVDVVPYIVRADGTEVIVNRADNAFESTNPVGFTAWMKDQNELAQGNLRKVIRLLKFLRDHKSTFSCKSVILTTVLGERVVSLDAETRYADVPTALKNIVNDVDAWLQLNPIKPSIEDPSCPGTSFDHRWDQDTYATFRDRIHRYAGWITDAHDEPDLDTSLEKWQKVFGPAFKKPVADAVREAGVAPAPPIAPAPAISRPTADRAPNEEVIRDLFPVAPRLNNATVDGRVLPFAGFRHGPLRGLGALQKKRELRFSVSTDVKPPYEVWWKVRNYGPEAAAANGLRGEIRKDEPGVVSHRETTLYSGTHWIECYIVKEGRVVATARHSVQIA